MEHGPLSLMIYHRTWWFFIVVVILKYHRVDKIRIGSSMGTWQSLRSLCYLTYNIYIYKLYVHLHDYECKSYINVYIQYYIDFTILCCMTVGFFPPILIDNLSPLALLCISWISNPAAAKLWKKASDGTSKGWASSKEAGWWF